MEYKPDDKQVKGNPVRILLFILLILVALIGGIVILNYTSPPTNKNIKVIYEDFFSEDIVVELKNINTNTNSTNTKNANFEPEIPEAFLLSGTSSWPETSPAINIRVRLTKPAVSVVTVGYTIVGGQAKKGSDYSLQDDLIVVIPIGEKEGLIRINIIDDTDIEADENIIIEIHEISNATVTRSAGNYNTTVIILDNDGPEPYCTDTDGGNNISEFGTVTYYVFGKDTEWTFDDTCRQEKNGINLSSGAYIVEHNCYGSQSSNPPNTSGSVSIVECDGGCLNGVCAGN